MPLLAPSGKQHQTRSFWLPFHHSPICPWLCQCVTSSVIWCTQNAKLDEAEAAEAAPKDRVLPPLLAVWTAEQKPEGKQEGQIAASPLNNASKYHM